MALGEIPPWLHVTPDTFLNAIKSGAGVGAEIRGQDVQQRGQDLAQAEARDRLSLAYAQLQSQEERQAEALQAKMALAHAQLSARQEQADMMNMFRDREATRREEAAKALDEYRTKSLSTTQQHYLDLTKAKQDLLDMSKKRLDEATAHHMENERMRQQMLDDRAGRRQLSQLQEFDLRQKAKALDAAHRALAGAQDHGTPEDVTRAQGVLDTAQKDYEQFRTSLNPPAPIPDQSSSILAPSPWVSAAAGGPGSASFDLTPSTVGQPEPAPAPSGKRIKVTGPDGQTGTIPEEQRDAATAAGYTVSE